MAKKVRCVDCGRLFDPDDDAARCPASGGIAYHRSEGDARSERDAR